jgi:hypothetical protein
MLQAAAGQCVRYAGQAAGVEIAQHALAACRETARRVNRDAAEAEAGVKSLL